jgi:peptidoglycan/LPS O-acetylase OafA/YrhL
MPRRRDLDLLRTIAIIGMVFYHLAYDLAMYYRWPLDIHQGTWRA